MKRTLTTLAATLLAMSASTLAQEAPKIAPRPNEVTGQEITEKQKQAVEKGLKWLAEHQSPQGAYGMNGAYGGGQGGHAGITGLAGLAFMEHGDLPGRGTYGKNVEKCVEFILTKGARKDGLLTTEQGGQPMYGHGFATVFLGEVYGMTGDDSIKEPLQNAVKLIQKTQNPEGGWRYQPVPYDADISVTICEIMGLRAADDAGIKVEEEVIKKAIQYIKDCQCQDGGFSYQAKQAGGSGFARTAAGVASLYYLGEASGKQVGDGLKYLKNAIPKAGSARDPMMEGHFYYGNYYATQAMFLAGGEYWQQWYPYIRDELLKRQTANGNWTGEAGDDYATAMSLIILQMPNRYLPVFNGKGPGG